MLHTIISWDKSLFTVMNDWTGHGVFADEVIKLLATYTVYLAPLFLLWLWFLKKEKIVALQALLAGAVAWLIIAKAVAQFVHRARPEVSMLNAKEIFFHRPDVSFPSDHTSFLFAITFTFYLMGKKSYGNLFLVLAITTGIFRVISGVHFPLDIIGGAAVGILTAYGLWCMRDFWKELVFEPVINFLKKFRL